MAEFEYDLLAEDERAFNSEAIEVLAHNREDQTLYVEFKSGNSYVYEDIEESTYNLMVGAESVGRFYRQHIMGGEVALRFYPSDEVDLVPTPTKVAPSTGNGTYHYPAGTIFTGSPYYGDNISLLSTEEHQKLHESDSANSGFYAHLSVTPPSRWSVKWNFVDADASLAGPFEPQVTANSEAGAIAIMEDSLLAAFGSTENIKILAVTHHLD